MLNTIKSKLLVLALLFFTITLFEAFMGFNHSATVKKDTNDLINRSLPSMSALHELEMDVVQVQQWLTDISATRAQDGLDDGFKEASAFANKFKEDVAELARLNPDLKDSLRILENSFDAYYQTGKRMAQAYVDGGPQAGNKTMGQFDQAAETLHDKIEQLSGTIEKQQSENILSLVEDSEATSTQNAIAVLILVAFLIIAAFAVQHLLLSPLEKFRSVIAKLNEGNANLSFRFANRGTDEISVISNELDAFFDSLQSIMAQLDQHARELEQEVSTTAATALQNHHSVINQQQEIESVTAAVEEMSATSEDVAQKTENTASDMNQARDMTLGASEAVNNTIASINRISGQISSTADTIKQLALDTEKIESMLEVIKSIAEQTNLLALNAAIEAARAGEQGRGFAVVADEVRSLAGKTQESTEEINTIINSLQRVSSDAVQLMEQNCKEVDICVNIAGQSGQLVTDIENTTLKVSDMATQIAAAMEQQSAVANEIARSLVKINDVSNEVAQGSTLTNTSMENLSQHAKTLSGMSNQFSMNN